MFVYLLHLVKQVRKPLALSQSLVSGPSGVEKHVNTDAVIGHNRYLCKCVFVIVWYCCKIFVFVYL